MPIPPAAFTSLRYLDSRITAEVLALREAAVDFDWGFDVSVPWERLSIFARHMDTAAPVTRMPVFALVEFGLDRASSARLDDIELETRIVFPSVPLGVVATDHVGYGSFDLWTLRHVAVLQSLKTALANVGLLDPGRPRLTLHLSRVLVLPYKDPAIAFDALIEGDVGPNFLCLRMDLDAVMLARRDVWPPMPAMQTPSIDDWRLSPGSFSMAGALLIGENGCETLLPANLATRMVRFRQLVRTRSEARAILGRERPRIFEIPGFSGAIRLGYNVAYQSEWFPIGHSLGQIAYSLPLAPGEKMKIAVVDWSRRDAAKRSEQTTEKEDLQHAALRDRTLTEAVQMVVRESQSGSSFMAGGALSAGAGIPIGPVSLGVGGAFGLGGASTDSEGMRSIVGDTTQKISDAFHQASSAQRELNSTVVVQAEQAEAAEARTRVVANYNHSHALTILYYEVLQHHRVLTKPSGVRPVVFLKHEATPLVFPETDPAKEPDYTFIEQYKQIIAANLLDESLRGCLDAVQKLLCLRQNFKAPPTNLPTDDFMLNEFLMKIKTGASAAKRDVTARLILKDGDPVDCLLLIEGSDVFNPPKLDKSLNSITHLFRIAANAEFWFHLVLQKPVRWGNIAKIELWQGTFPNTKWEGVGEDPWDIESVHACTNAEPLYWVMANGAPPFSPLPHNGTMQVPVQRYVPGPDKAEGMLTDEERCCLRRIIDHLNAHRGHYWRAVWLAEDPADRAVRLEGWSVGGVPLLDLLENTVLDVDGEYVVMPLVGGASRFLDREFQTHELGLSKTPYLEYVEQLLTVPARGVFAEAKLGHCNASELIDPSRFWDWQTSPIPDEAPAIAPASTGSLYQDPTKGLASTPFPQPIVNIVNPQSLPDPTGFSSVAGVLSALGPFRDMSGIKELGSYLETLSNNATQLASQGLKGAQTASLLNTIRSAKEIPPEKRADLISELVTGQVKNQAAPPPTPAPKPEPQPQQPPLPEQPPQPPQQPQQPQQPTPQPQQPTPGVPKPSEPRKPTVLGPKTRRLTFAFYFDTMAHMPGEYVIEILDIESNKLYVADPQSASSYLYFMDVPTSIKSSIFLSIRGPVKPTSFEVTGKVSPQPWTYELSTSKQFASLDNITGFDITAAGKDTNVELTYEKDQGSEWSHGSSNESSVVTKGGGGLDKVVEISVEGGYKYTVNDDTVTNQGTKDIRVIKMVIRSLDKTKQPTIKEVKKT